MGVSLTGQRGRHPERRQRDAHEGDLRVVPPAEVEPVRPRVHGAVALGAVVANTVPVSHRNSQSLIDDSHRNLKFET